MPIGAAFGPIRVIADGLSADSSELFVPKSANSAPVSPLSFAHLGTTNLPIAFYPGVSAAYGTTAADFNGDGKPDLAAVHQNTITIHTNCHAGEYLGTNSFALALQLPAVSFVNLILADDLNGDGKIDLLAGTGFGGKFGIYENLSSDGNFTFGEMVQFSFENTGYHHRFATADVDKDGFVDIVYGDRDFNFRHGFTVLRNKGTNSVSQFTYENPRRFATSNRGVGDLTTLGDLDNDGSEDVIVASYPNVEIFRNLSTSGSITFESPLVLTGVYSSVGIGVADLNQDGLKEVVAASLHEGILVYENLGLTNNHFAFAPPIKVDAPGYPALSSLALVDVNGDGFIDITATRIGLLTVFPHSGRDSISQAFPKRFDFRIPLNGGSSAYEVAACYADFNLDGNPDFFVDDDHTAITIAQNFVTPVGPSFLRISTATNLSIPWQRYDRPTATLYMNDGSGSNVTAFTTWTSSDTNTITISTGGILLAHGPGTAVITGVYSGFQDSYEVTVATNAPSNRVGTLDHSFAPLIENGGSTGVVNCIEFDARGNLYIGGDFMTVNGITSPRIARLNDDGTIDPTFDVGRGLNAPVNSILVQPDGKILIAGGFTTYDDETAVSVVRLGVDGTIDPTFQATVPSVLAMALQGDGKILLSHTLSPNLTRLETNGARDGSFNPPSLSNAPSSILITGDGKILLGGSFDLGNRTHGIIRLNHDGTLDGSFSPVEAASVHAMAFQGTNLIFSQISSSLIPRVSRASGNGEIDSTFLSFTPFVIPEALVVTENGKIIVPQNFNLTVRRTANGAFDTTYNQNVPLPFSIKIMKAGEDSMVYIAGGMSNWRGVPTMGIARVQMEVETFAAWQRKHFSWQQISDPEVSGPGANENQDGVPNFVKYAFGYSPKTLLTNEPIRMLRYGTNFLLRFEFNQAGTDFLLKIQASGRLEGPWVDAVEWNSTNGATVVNGRYGQLFVTPTGRYTFAAYNPGTNRFLRTVIQQQ